MSSEADVEVVLDALSYLRFSNDQPSLIKAQCGKEARAAFTRLSDRLQRCEAALRFYAESSDNYMTAQAALAGMTKEEFRTAEARRDAATQETGE